MKTLEEVDLTSVYPAIKGYRPHHMNDDIRQLCLRLMHENEPLSFKNTFISVLQLHFEDLVTNWMGTPEYGSSETRERWEKEKAVLEKLLEAGKKFICSFYNGKPKIEPVREAIFETSPSILSTSMYYRVRGCPNMGNLVNKVQDIQRFGLETPKILEKEIIDGVACIAPLGFEPALLLAEIFEKDILILGGQESRRTKPIKAPEDYLKNFTEGRAIVAVDSGVTTAFDLSHSLLEIYKTKPLGLYCAIPVLGKERPNWMSQDETDFQLCFLKGEIKMLNKDAPSVFEYKLSS